MHYFRGMRNVTITLDDDTAHWVRVEAARRGASVSRLVGELLRERRLHEAEYEAATERFLGRGPRVLKGPDESYPGRDELHERSGR